jgi:hypothetical protein
MDIGSGYPPLTVNQPSPEGARENSAESVALVVEAQKATSEAIKLDRVQITQYGDTLSVDNSAVQKVEPPNTYNKFGKLPDSAR